MDVLHETRNLTIDTDGDVYLRVYLDDVEFDTLHVGRVMPDGWYCQDRHLTFTPLAQPGEIDAIEAVFTDHMSDACDVQAEWDRTYHSDLMRA